MKRPIALDTGEAIARLPANGGESATDIPAPTSIGYRYPHVSIGPNIRSCHLARGTIQSGSIIYTRAHIGKTSPHVQGTPVHNHRIDGTICDPGGGVGCARLGERGGDRIRNEKEGEDTYRDHPSGPVSVTNGKNGKYEAGWMDRPHEIRGLSKMLGTGVTSEVHPPAEDFDCHQCIALPNMRGLAPDSHRGDAWAWERLGSFPKKSAESVVGGGTSALQLLEVGPGRHAMDLEEGVMKGAAVGEPRLGGEGLHGECGSIVAV